MGEDVTCRCDARACYTADAPVGGSIKKESRQLFGRAVSSSTLSVEMFNRPSDLGRTEAVLLLLDHSFEMLLKSAIVQRSGKSRERGEDSTIGFKTCVSRARSNADIKFVEEEEARLLLAINGFRDAARHHIVDVPEQLIYFHAQPGLTLFRDLAKRVFGIDLALYLPARVLPLSTSAPLDFGALFEAQFAEIRLLLRRAVSSLRGLPTHPPVLLWGHGPHAPTLESDASRTSARAPCPQPPSGVLPASTHEHGAAGALVPARRRDQLRFQSEGVGACPHKEYGRVGG